jgi:hypothetical protein
MKKFKIKLQNSFLFYENVKMLPIFFYLRRMLHMKLNKKKASPAGPDEFLVRISLDVKFIEP